MSSQRKIVHNGLLLKLILRAMQVAEPIRWREALEEMRYSRKLRKFILREARNDANFRMYCACLRVKI